MPDHPEGLELLHLAVEFPAVKTEQWEAAIRADLKGADYEKKLIWRTDEGIAVKPYFRREDAEKLGDLADLAPGEFPHARGTGRPWKEAQDFDLAQDAIRADFVHEAGGTAVQELGFALSEAVERLRSALDSGKSLAVAAPATTFVYAIGANYFFEIAKLRASRALWATAVSAFGSDDPKIGTASIHARTALFNKSLVDPYTNLLRCTTEALSAVIGGCDSLEVQAVGFEPRLALGIQRVLREEAKLDYVLDPAGGSYYIERLTDALAREAWRLFQQVEAAGGWSAGLNTGFVERELTKSREAKVKALSSRRKTMVGVNNYPNLTEKEPEASGPGPLLDDPFPQVRLAEPFERIRRRTAAHAHRTGQYPKVLLLKRGDLKMKMARANFCLNFFGCAGFDTTESEEYDGSDADLIVLCSSDPEYLPFASEVCAATKVPVLVAGNPKEQISQLEGVGIQGFVHVLSDAIQTLTEWQNRLGIPELEH